MNIFRCPYLDRLARDMIDMYRRIEDTGGVNLSNELQAIHASITQHRSTCSLCREIEACIRPERSRHADTVS